MRYVFFYIKLGLLNKIHCLSLQPNFFKIHKVIWHICYIYNVFLFSIFYTFLIIASPCVSAHHPHDHVDQLAISPHYNVNNSIYFARGKLLFKSKDGGYSWNELINGLDNNSRITSIAISRQNTVEDLLFISTHRNGIYKSKNGGQSWTPVNNGLKSLNIKRVSIYSPNILFAFDEHGEFYKSDNGGDLWIKVRFLDNTVITAISPTSPIHKKHILAGDKNGNIFLSIDIGTSWQAISQLPNNTKVNNIKFDPSYESSLSWFASSEDGGFFYTVDNGNSYKYLSKELPNEQIMSIEFSDNYKHNQMIAVTTWNQALFISNNRGVNWTKYNNGLTTDKQADTEKYFSPHFRQIKFVPENNETMFVAGFDGLFKTVDGGKNWFELEILPVSLIKELAISPSKDGDYSLGITTYGGGAYLSHDQGESWITSNNGLERTRLMGMQFSPSYHDDQSIFTASSGLLLKSTNRGVSWEKIKLKYSTLKSRIVKKLKHIGILRTDINQYLSKREIQNVYPTEIALAQDYINSNTILFGTRWHGMYISHEGGQSASPTGKVVKGAITSLSLSPNFTDDGLAFIFINEKGVFKTNDWGASWNNVSGGLPFASINDDNTSNVELRGFDIVFSTTSNTDKTLFIAGPLGLYVSKDSGNKWDKLIKTKHGNSYNIYSIDVSPNFVNDSTLLISSKGRGLYKSTDGGINFFETGKDLIRKNHSIEHIKFSPNFAEDNTIYAASENYVFRSRDGGKNWIMLLRSIRYENHRGVIHYSGNWLKKADSASSASSFHYSTNIGDKASLTFVGCGVEWIATRSPEGGMANVYIDNSLVSTVDLHENEYLPMSRVFSKSKLDCAPHRIVIEVVRNKEGNSGNKVNLDAFEVDLNNKM